MLVGVKNTDIDLVWSIVAPMIQRAIDKSEHDYSIDDVYHHLCQRNMQLWYWVGDCGIIACMVSVIASYPNRKVCQLPFIGGKGLRIWIHAEPIIAAWAKEQGCTQLEGFCRQGWVRVLKNWRVVWQTMRKDI